MRKSPGKWIKGILFGRKGSKFNPSTGRELSRSASEKPAQVFSKEPVSTSNIDTPLITGSVSRTVSDRIEISSFEKGEGALLASELQISSPANKEKDKPSDIGVPNDPEKIITLEQAAIIMQAFFRGYQARHDYQTLKGVVQLQAAVRGHLVRRQAVATLFCMQGIVKFQAITRGHMVRRARTGNGHCRKQSPLVKDASNQDSCEFNYSRAKTLSKNAFIHELLASSRTSVPLRLEYDPGDSNSAQSWLLRWSISQVWGPNVKQNESGDSKLQMVKTEQIKSKHNGRKAPSVTVRNDPNIASAESEKLKLAGRKLSSQPVQSAPEHPQFENDKVKRGVKKNQKSIGEISNEETDINKPKRHQRKLSKSSAPKSSERTSNTPTGKLMKDLVEPEVNGIASQLTGHLPSEEHQKFISNKSQDILTLEKDFRDDQISSENYKSDQTTSLPVKHDDQDVTRESVTRVPSYMATTASSKAKVKAQASPRFGQDETERNALTRRHSLPSSINGKLISSPRIHKLVQSNGKGGLKIDRSLSTSRETADKVNLVDWKR